MFAHSIGYSFIEAGDAGLERYYNDELSGQKDEFASLLDQILGDRKEGEDLRTTLDPQRAAGGARRRSAGATGRSSRSSRTPARCS